MVDLPPDEATTFRETCASASLSYVPLIAPATSINRMKFLASIADSFIYVVSKVCFFVAPSLLTLSMLYSLRH